MYGKVFSSMYDGSLATRGPWQALVTFQQLIVLCDRDGVVDMTDEAISRRTTVPLEIIRIGLAALLEPDPQSRSPDEQGRRIVPVSSSRDWGWQIVNYGKYRGIRSAEERREYHRKYWREVRSTDPAEPFTASTHATDSTETQQSQPRAVSSKQEASVEPRGTRLPDNWSLPPEWAAWAAEQRSELNIHSTAAAFADYWHSVPGAKARKRDWFATWRTWVRNQRGARSDHSARASEVQGKDYM